MLIVLKFILNFHFHLIMIEMHLLMMLLFISLFNISIDIIKVIVISILEPDYYALYRIIIIDAMLKPSSLSIQIFVNSKVPN